MGQANPNQIPRLSSSPLCPICKDIELTVEEQQHGGQGVPACCWHCAARTLVQLNDFNNIPDPKLWGRPDLDLSAEIVKIQESLRKPMFGFDTVSTKNSAAPKTKQVAATELHLTPDERRAFILAHGSDPLPEKLSTTITVFGANEDVYMTFNMPAQISEGEQEELQRLMQELLNIFGMYLKYGAKFSHSLLQLEKLDATMFLGGK